MHSNTPETNHQPLRYVSCNIEGDRHLEARVFPMVKTLQPDFISFQEVFEADFEDIKDTLGMAGDFVPMVNVINQQIHLPARGVLGIAQFWNEACEVQEGGYEYYAGADPDTQDLPIFFENENANAMRRAVQWHVVSFGGAEFRFAHTHFTWSPRGEFTADQQRDFQAMQEVLADFPDLVLSGDLNSPRRSNAEEQASVFNTLASTYTDNIPAEVVTTIDNNLHKANERIELVVDCLFSSDAYQVTNAQVLDGVSDHMLVTGEIRKKD